MARKTTSGKTGRFDASPVGDEISLEIVKSAVDSPDPSARTVHLIHPSSDVLIRLFDLLSDAGFQVSASSNADDALGYVARSHPKFLIAAMDMPEMTGLELLLRARMGSPSTRIIMMSDYPDGSAALMAKNAGASEVIDKDIDGEPFLQVVKRAFELE